MLLQFENLELRSICEHKELAVEQLGDSALLLFSFLSDLQAASHMSDLPPGLIERDKNSQGDLFFSLGDYQLWFKPNKKNLPSGIDQNDESHWYLVDRVKILEIKKNG